MFPTAVAGTPVPPAAVLCGLAGWVPSRVVTNEHLARRLDTDDAWIRTRTGIGSRHVVDPGQATSDLAVEAGRRASPRPGSTASTPSSSPRRPRTTAVPPPRPRSPHVSV